MKQDQARKIWSALRSCPFGDRLSEEVGLPGLYLVVGHRMQAKSTTLYNFCYERSEEWRSAYDQNGGLFGNLDVSVKVDDVEVAILFGGEPEYTTRFEQLYANILESSAPITIADSLRKMALTRVRVAPIEGHEDEAIEKGLLPPKATLSGLVSVTYSPTDQIWERGATAQMIEQLDYLGNQCLRTDRYCVATFNPLLSDSPQFRSMLEGSALGIISLDGMSPTSYRTYDRVNHRVRTGLNAGSPTVAEQWLRDPMIEDMYGKPAKEAAHD